VNPKMVGFPNNHGVFLLKMIMTWGVKWGYHYFRKHPNQRWLGAWFDRFCCFPQVENTFRYFVKKIYPGPKISPLSSFRCFFGIYVTEMYVFIPSYIYIYMCIPLVYAEKASMVVGWSWIHKMNRWDACIILVKLLGKSVAIFRYDINIYIYIYTYIYIYMSIYNIIYIYV